MHHGGSIGFDEGGVYEKNHRMRGEGGGATSYVLPTMRKPANTHCDVTDLVNHFMVKNTKNGIS